MPATSRASAAEERARREGATLNLWREAAGVAAVTSRAIHYDEELAAALQRVPVIRVRVVHRLRSDSGSGNRAHRVLSG